MEQSENRSFRFVPYRMYQCRERRDAWERPCLNKPGTDLFRPYLRRLTLDVGRSGLEFDRWRAVRPGLEPLTQPEHVARPHQVPLAQMAHQHVVLTCDAPERFTRAHAVDNGLPRARGLGRSHDGSATGLGGDDRRDRPLGQRNQQILADAEEIAPELVGRADG